MSGYELGGEVSGVDMRSDFLIVGFEPSETHRARVRVMPSFEAHEDLCASIELLTFSSLSHDERLTTIEARSDLMPEAVLRRMARAVLMANSFTVEDRTGEYNLSKEKRTEIIQILRKHATLKRR